MLILLVGTGGFFEISTETEREIKRSDLEERLAKKRILVKQTAVEAEGDPTYLCVCRNITGRLSPLQWHQTPAQLCWRSQPHQHNYIISLASLFQRCLFPALPPFLVHFYGPFHTRNPENFLICLFMFLLQ